MAISRLKLARLELGLRQFDLAKRVGIGENLVSKIETGRTRPSRLIVERLAGILGLKPEDLAADSNNPPERPNSKRGPHRSGKQAEKT